MRFRAFGMMNTLKVSQMDQQNKSMRMVQWRHSNLRPCRQKIKSKRLKTGKTPKCDCLLDYDMHQCINVDEIKRHIENTNKQLERAIRSDFDIHRNPCCSWYLIHEFISPLSNDPVLTIMVGQPFQSVARFFIASSY